MMPATSLADRLERAVVRGAAVALPLFVLVEVNRPSLSPHSRLALFALLGLLLCFLGGERPASRLRRLLDLGAALVATLSCLYLVVQTEPLFAPLWLGGRSLGNRAGIEQPLDLVVAAAGLLVVLEAARRTVGPALPILSLAFVAYALAGPHLPEALLPHRGYGLERIVAQSFLHSQGVFGIALGVMFSYVFLFVVFGALLERTGATGYVLAASRRLFGGSAGGPAKVAVVSSGLLGSLSGSAVANTATTGTFTIPMMRSAGFSREEAAGVEAAASSGGALVPPVMGAGAYMMLEIIDPPVTYLQILQAALLPACLYYLSLLLIVHFSARRRWLAGSEAAAGPRVPAKLAELEGQPGPEGPPGAAAGGGAEGPLPEGAAPGERSPPEGLLRWEGLVCGTGLVVLMGFLLTGWSIFRAVTWALAATFAVAALNRRTRVGPRGVLAAFRGASAAGVALVAASACVGIVIGVVTMTGAGTRLPAVILPLAESHLLPALAVIMACSIVLGMGLPSAVCYLLLATLIGPALGPLGVPPLAGHLFIFYFGLMSMVTPPVALAGYAASSIAGSHVFRTSLYAFRYALVGFTLPYLFVFRPQLLMLDPAGGAADWGSVALAVLLAVLGIVPLAAALGGSLLRPLTALPRVLLFLAAALALVPGAGPILRSERISVLNLAGIALFLAVAAAQAFAGRRDGPAG